MEYFEHFDNGLKVDGEYNLFTLCAVDPFMIDNFVLVILWFSDFAL